MSRGDDIARERRAREQRDRARRRTSRPVRTPEPREMSARARSTTSSGSDVAAAVRERHEGLVGWALRMVRSAPSSIAEAVTGFVREVGDLASAPVRPLVRRFRRGGSAGTDAVPSAPRVSVPEISIPRVLGPRREPAHGGFVRTRADERKRQLLRRRVRAVAAIVLLVAIVIAWRTVPHAGVFRIQHIEIVGASSVGDLEVRQRIDGDLRGATIYDIDADAIARDVRAFPFVRSVTVDSHFPSGVTVHVVEHQPLALGYDTGSKEWWLISPDGRVLASADSKDWKGRVPLVRLRDKDLEPGSRLRSEPTIALLIAQAQDSTLAIESIDIGAFTVTAQLQNGVEVRFGRPQQLRTKLAVAQRMLSIMRIKGQDWKYLDVSVPAQAVPCPRTALCAAIPPPDEQAVRTASAARVAAAENRSIGVATTAETGAADDSTVAEPEPTVGGPAAGPTSVRKPPRTDAFDAATNPSAEGTADN